MRYKARTDANHKEIADAFRTLGCYVVDLSRVGCGVPDLHVTYRWLSCLVEVKTAEGKYTKAQERFNAEYPGMRFMVRDMAGVETAVKWLRDTAK